MGFSKISSVRILYEKCLYSRNLQLFYNVVMFSQNMSNGLNPREKASSAMSLVEVLIVIVVIGIIAAIGLPAINNIRESAKEAAAVQNAKNIQQMSGALAALGVAHVIPDSMGGVAATARLLREGVIVPEGPMAGEKFVLSGLRDDEIDAISEYLYVEYDRRELRLIFRDPKLQTGGPTLLRAGLMLCRFALPLERVGLSTAILPGMMGVR
jgi:prepilin-type N-terminal cleavage/methylation domain-containing protein